MADKSEQPKGQGDAFSSLNVAIDGLNRAKDATSFTSAKTAFMSASVLLATIRVSVSFWFLFI